MASSDEPAPDRPPTAREIMRLRIEQRPQAPVMSLRLTLFVLTSPEAGAPLGYGLICPEARYVSVKRTGSPSLVRRFLSGAEWRAVEQEFSVGLPSGPLPPRGAIVKALTDASLIVKYVRQDEVTIERPELVTTRLDTVLRDLSGPDVTS